MAEELTPEQKFAAEDPGTMVPRALMEGRLPQDIVAELLRLDYTPEAAWSIVQQAQVDLQRYRESPTGREQVLRAAKAQVFTGTLLLMMAIAGTAIAFLAAASGQMPFFVIATGALVLGLVLIVRGGSRWRFYASLPSQDLPRPPRPPPIPPR